MTDKAQEGAKAPISGIGFWFALWQAQFEANLKFWAALGGMTPLSAREAANLAESHRSEAEAASAAQRKAG